MAQSTSPVSPAKIFARPAAEEIWLGPAQRAALSHVFTGHRHKYLLGPPSCGKSTLLRHAEAARPDTVVLRLAGPRNSAVDVLTGLLTSADLAPWTLGETDQRNLLTVYIQHRRAQRRRVIALIDDAHRFAPAARREIERLCRPEDGAPPMLEVTAIAPSDDATPLELPGEPACHSMPALSGSVLREYLEWRVGRFELPFPFTDAALSLIDTACGGRYAAVDALCHMALLLNRERAARIDAPQIRQAMRAYASRRQRAEPRPQPNDRAPPGRKPPTGRIVVMHNGKVVETVVLGKRLLLGRSLENDVSLASSAVSRFHAVIVATPEKYFIVDLDSTNGVRLNGMPVGRVELCDQDIVAIGPFQLRILLQVPAERPAGPAEGLERTDVMPRQIEVPPIRLVK